jgi:hypothetical protein
MCLVPPRREDPAPPLSFLNFLDLPFLLFVLDAHFAALPEPAAPSRLLVFFIVAHMTTLRHTLQHWTLTGS